jgi:hypothetical protein
MRIISGTYLELTNLRTLSLNCWKQGITTVHFVFPLPKQEYLVWDAKDPHNQSQFAKVFETMKGYIGLDIKFIFYNPASNHSNDFLFVINGKDAQ